MTTTTTSTSTSKTWQRDPRSWGVITETGSPVADVWQRDAIDLIVAAPDLLAACMYALDVMERVAHTVDREELDAVVEVAALARAAIAKAKGEK